jgi:hypothetical protein
MDDQGREHRDPAILLVSNNPYAVEHTVARAKRPRLDGGRLGVVVFEPPGTLQAPFTAWATPAVEVAADGPTHVGLDGEALTRAAPLRFTIPPGALRVRISARHPGASPSAELAALRSAPPRITQKGRRRLTHLGVILGPTSSGAAASATGSPIERRARRGSFPPASPATHPKRRHR